jgi:hypothetical protein
MTDAGGFTCDQFRERSAELALGVLPARERAAVMEHLQHCAACCEHVREMTLAADALLDLIPGREPPIGFEARVFQRIGLPPQPRHRAAWRRVALLGAAAAVAFALGMGGWVLGSSPNAHVPAASSTAPGFPGPALRAAALTTAKGQPVGQVFAYPGQSPWVYMTVDADKIAADRPVRCQLQLADGSTIGLGSFALTHGYGHWGGPYAVGSTAVTAVRLLGMDGSVLATATFPTAKG